MVFNNWWLGLFILLMIILVIWLIRRNLKDKKSFEKDLMASELKPEEDKQEKDESL
jgi:cytochrome c biogenesis protein ResB